jgi:hypothetical protein
MPSVRANEICRVLVNGKYVKGVCLYENKTKPSARFRIDGKERTVLLKDVWKMKKTTTSAKKKKGNVGCRSVEKLPTRRGRFRRPVTVVPVRFQYGQTNGDFSLMLHDVNYKIDGVMCFNDNDWQWQRFLNTGEPDLAGGGNACARPWQHQGHSIGVPTGPYGALDEIRHNVRFPEDGTLDRTAKQIIDRAFVQIRDLFVSRTDKEVLYYSAEDNTDKIGLRIFAGRVGDDVVDYITQKFKEIPEEVRKARFA